MPLLTETTHPRKRRVPVWLLILAVVVSPLVAVFGWSCFRPVRIEIGVTRIILFGWYDERGTPYDPDGIPGLGHIALKLPGGPKSGTYYAGYLWQ